MFCIRCRWLAFCNVLTWIFEQVIKINEAARNHFQNNFTIIGMVLSQQAYSVTVNRISLACVISQPYGLVISKLFRSMKQIDTMTSVKIRVVHGDD